MDPADEIRKSLVSKESGSRFLQFVGVGRVEPTKAWPEQVRAFRLFLAQHPALQGQVQLTLYLAGSRGSQPEYQSEMVRLDEEVQATNVLSRDGWVPVQILWERPQEEVRRAARGARVLLIVPWLDGCNLTALEGTVIAADATRQGADPAALILSAGAGASTLLGDNAVVVEMDFQRPQKSVARLVKAMKETMSLSENKRRERLEAADRAVRAHNLGWWLDQIFRDVGISEDS